MKLGLPTGAETEKIGPIDEGSDVPTTGTPPGRFVPPEPAELAKQFPQLEILELLGQGGMGAVYKARQKELDRVVARAGFRVLKDKRFLLGMIRALKIAPAQREPQPAAAPAS